MSFTKFCKTKVHAGASRSVLFARREAGEVMVTGGLEGSIKIWVEDPDKHEYQCIKEFKCMMAVSGLDNKKHLLAAASLDGYVRIFDLNSLELIQRIDCGHAQCWDVSVSPDLKLVATGGHDGLCRVWDIGKRDAPPRFVLGKDVKFKKTRPFCLAVCFSNNGKTLACSYTGHNPPVATFDMTQKGVKKQTMTGATLTVRRLVFGHGDRYLCAAAQDMVLHIFDLRDGKETAGFSGHKEAATSCAFSPDSTQIASVSVDRRLKVWDISQKACAHTFTHHDEPVWDVAFNDRGSRLATVGDEGYVTVYLVQK